jgi:hypothetical protein
LKKLIPFLALSILLIPVGSQSAFAQSIQTDFPVNVGCNSVGQLCTPLHTSSIDTQSELKVKYTVLPNHCSSLRVNVFLDGNPVATSQFLGWPGAPFPFDSLPLMTGVIDLGPVSPGTYQISLQGEGQVSGCNSGQLGGWGGTLTVFSDEAMPQVVGGKTMSIDSTLLLVSGTQTFSWMIPLVLSGIGIGLFVIKKSENS